MCICIKPTCSRTACFIAKQRKPLRGRLPEARRQRSQRLWRRNGQSAPGRAGEGRAGRPQASESRGVLFMTWTCHADCAPSNWVLLKTMSRDKVKWSAVQKDAGGLIVSSARHFSWKCWQPWTGTCTSPQTQRAACSVSENACWCLLSSHMLLAEKERSVREKRDQNRVCIHQAWVVHPACCLPRQASCPVAVKLSWASLTWGEGNFVALQEHQAGAARVFQPRFLWLASSMLHT